MSYGLNVRLSERTKNMSDSDIKFIASEKEKIVSHCAKEGIILKSADKIRETSVVNQIWSGIKYCQQNNLTLVKIYIDLYLSGSNWERKEMLEMLNDFDSGLIKGFVFKDLTRYARDLFYQEEVLKTYRDLKGADFRFIDGQEISQNELNRKVMGVMNEAPIIFGKQNAAKTMKNKRELGLPCIPAPFGYRYDDTKNWAIVEKEAMIVRKVVGRKGENFSQVCKDLNINPSLYYRILKNADKGLYRGTITFTKKYKDLTGKVVKTEEISYQGNYEAIL
jgi:DNA invertase Pin-like site-specific DNA recombinase